MNKHILPFLLVVGLTFLLALSMSFCFQARFTVEENKPSPVLSYQ